MLAHIEALVCPDLFIIGGGVSKKSEKGPLRRVCLLALLSSNWPIFILLRCAYLINRKGMHH